MRSWRRCARTFRRASSTTARRTRDGQKFLADHGFTVEEFRARWRQRMEVLRFIEVRFRNGIHDLG